MHRNLKSLVGMALGLAASVGIGGPAWADPFTGPISPYYLDNSENRTIYVVQGTSVVNSFPWSYGCIQPACEANLAITNEFISTNWRGNFNSAQERAGQYTLGGTPTGVSWPSSLPLPATGNHRIYDGTSDGARIYTVEFTTSLAPPQVLSYDLQWQNPTALFGVTSGKLGITNPASKYISQQPEAARGNRRIGRK